MWMDEKPLQTTPPRHSAVSEAPVPWTVADAIREYPDLVGAWRDVERILNALSCLANGLELADGETSVLPPLAEFFVRLEPFPSLTDGARSELASAGASQLLVSAVAGSSSTDAMWRLAEAVRDKATGRGFATLFALLIAAIPTELRSDGAAVGRALRCALFAQAVPSAQDEMFGSEWTTVRTALQSNRALRRAATRIPAKQLHVDVRALLEGFDYSQAVLSLRSEFARVALKREPVDREEQRFLSLTAKQRELLRLLYRRQVVAAGAAATVLYERDDSFTMRTLAELVLRTNRSLAAREVPYQVKSVGSAYLLV
jgi:hypothetical protein